MCAFPPGRRWSVCRERFVKQQPSAKAPLLFAPRNVRPKNQPNRATTPGNSVRSGGASGLRHGDPTAARAHHVGLAPRIGRLLLAARVLPQEQRPGHEGNRDTGTLVRAARPRRGPQRPCAHVSRNKRHSNHDLPYRPSGRPPLAGLQVGCSGTPYDRAATTGWRHLQGRGHGLQAAAHHPLRPRRRHRRMKCCTWSAEHAGKSFTPSASAKCSA